MDRVVASAEVWKCAVCTFFFSSRGRHTISDRDWSSDVWSSDLCVQRGSRTMRFEFATATRIIFGASALRGVGLVAKEFGDRALVVTGKGVDRARPLLALLEADRKSVV